MKEYPTKQIDKMVLYPSISLQSLLLLDYFVNITHTMRIRLCKSLVILYWYKCKKVIREKIEPGDSIICNNYVG